jgi:hypothetical protein
MVENRFRITSPGGLESPYQESMQWQQNLFIYKKKTLIKLKGYF